MLTHYGINSGPTGLLDWSFVDERMGKARNYWVCTVRADGRPHASPVWGIWLEGVLYFGISRHSVKGQNAARDPRVTIHLESGDETVIFEGRLLELTDSAVYARVRAAYNSKYGMEALTEKPDPASAVYYLEPSSVLAWLEADFPNTATRWSFNDTAMAD
jgi:hypothetical protein